jgi:hypothetical protein
MQVSEEDQQLENLKQMFPSVDRSVIKMILDSNQSREDLAIDALLQLSQSPSVAPKDAKEGDAKVPSDAKQSASIDEKPAELVKDDELRKSQQIHDDELLAKALQHELRVSDNVPISDKTLTKAVQQLESDEALAISLQNEAYLSEVARAERAQNPAADSSKSQKDGSSSRDEADEEVVTDDNGSESEDILEEVSAGIDDAMTKAGQKMEEFGKDVSNAWSNFTTVVGLKFNETFNPDGGPSSPQLIVRSAQRNNGKNEDEEKQPFL